MTLTHEQLAKSREDSINEFDEWWSETYLNSFGGMPNSIMLSFREVAWKAWMARQQSLVVELPDHFCYELPHGGDSDHCYEKLEILNMLQSAGINYREKE